jgi:hypothetical protein
MSIRVHMTLPWITSRHKITEDDGKNAGRIKARLLDDKLMKDQIVAKVKKTHRRHHDV